MQIETKYSYEKIWRATSQNDLLKIIVEEVGDYDPEGVLKYVKESLKKGKIITVGSCGFRTCGEKK